MKRPTTLITGITGQDGSYLADFLLKKGYVVHGIKRRARLFSTQRIDHLYQEPAAQTDDFKPHFGDLTDSTNLIRVIQEVQPDEICNLGAQSHGHVSFDTPEYTTNADGNRDLLPPAGTPLVTVRTTRHVNVSCSTMYYSSKSGSSHVGEPRRFPSVADTGRDGVLVNIKPNKNRGLGSMGHCVAVHGSG